MEKYLPLLAQTPLFSSLLVSEIPQMLSCLEAKMMTFRSKEVIVYQDQIVKEIGVVLAGSVQVSTVDVFGNRTITTALHLGEPFGRLGASVEQKKSPVAVEALTDCDVLFLRFDKLVAPCSNACPFHSRVIANMMSVLADRNLLMNKKLAILSQRTIREKLLSFLLWQSELAGSPAFTIPYNRDELADFLSVNRSALSRELSMMVHEGLLETQRSYFRLLDEAFI